MVMDLIVILLTLKFTMVQPRQVVILIMSRIFRQVMGGLLRELQSLLMMHIQTQLDQPVPVVEIMLLGVYNK